MQTKIIIFLLLIFLVSVWVVASCQTQWTKYADNPVFTKGPSNWDIIAVGQPTCLIENDTVKMWYVAVGNDMKARISYAWSLNGIHWTKYNNAAPVLNLGDLGKWDSGWLDAPEIVKDAYGYKMYYAGDTAKQSPEISSAYGVATSPDGITWTKYSGNPILKRGSNSAWDRSWIEYPAVLYDSVSRNYLMWYSGIDTSTWKIQTGLATSPDGFAWTKYSGNPVITSGTAGSYDDMWVATPAVIKKGNEFEMWYSAFSSTSGYDTLRIAYTTSSDGINWIKYSGNPLFSTITPPYLAQVDAQGPWAPDVVFDAKTNTYNMWYETKAGFCFATSSATVGVPEQIRFSTDEIKIYPNPSNNLIQVELPNRHHNYSIEVYSIIGQQLLKTSDKKVIDISNFASGIYILRIIMDNEKKIEKQFLIQ